MIIMMVPQLLNIVTCGRFNWGEDGTGYKDGNFEAYAQAMRKVCGRKNVHFSQLLIIFNKPDVLTTRWEGLPLSKFLEWIYEIASLII